MTPSNGAFATGLDLVLEQLTAQKRLLHRTPSATPSTLQNLLQVRSKIALRKTILFVGESAPGETNPYAGEAGQLLKKIIAAMDVPSADVTIHLLPKSDTKKSESSSIDMAALLPVIEQVQPGAIVALGSTAATLLTDSKRPIGEARSQWLDYRGTPLLITYHPSYLIHKPSNSEKRKVWEDLLMVMEKLGLPISQAQQNFFLRKT